MQKLNAPSPIEVTLSGILIDVKNVHRKNAQFSISLTGLPSYSAGITTSPLILLFKVLTV